MARSRRPCGSWPSPITSETLTRGTRGVGDPRVLGGVLHFVEARPDEGGRQTVMRRRDDGEVEEVLPRALNARSRVHEYGGTPYTGDGSRLVVSDCASGRLHGVDADGGCVPLTPEGDLRFADMVLDPGRDRVIAVMEDHGGGGEAVNTIVAVPLAGGAPVGLVAGHDFVAWPRLSPDGSRLAWVTWDHPDMPWDATVLWCADLDAGGGVGTPVPVAGGEGVSAIEPSWAPDGSLWWSEDSTGWWNLRRRSPDGVVTAPAPMEAETAGPAWVLGQCGHCHVDGGVVAVARAEGGARLVEVRSDGEVRSVPSGERPVVVGTVVATGPRTVATVAASEVLAAALCEIDLDTGAVTVVRTTGAAEAGTAWISRPQHVTAPSAGGRTTHAWFYPPHHPDVEPLEGELPPLRVIAHGGPTSAADVRLQWGVQYWTSRGFAVLDVDYGGSTGYGTAYRRLLDGGWGVVDVEDVVAAVDAVCGRGLADRHRVSMSGGSAGGFTVLLALTTTDVLAAGCSLFGVGDLGALARETHKFESRYTDRLVGPWPAAEAVYRERSPLTHVADLHTPVVLFQGADDRIVPPDQSRTFFAAARAAGVPCAYEEYPGEGHGFRRRETIRRALDGELVFLCRVYGVSPDVVLDPPLEVINAPAP